MDYRNIPIGTRLRVASGDEVRVVSTGPDYRDGRLTLTVRREGGSSFPQTYRSQEDFDQRVTVLDPEWFPASSRPLHRGDYLRIRFTDEASGITFEQFVTFLSLGFDGMILVCDEQGDTVGYTASAIEIDVQEN